MVKDAISEVIETLPEELKSFVLDRSAYCRQSIAELIVNTLVDDRQHPDDESRCLIMPDDSGCCVPCGMKNACWREERSNVFALRHMSKRGVKQRAERLQHLFADLENGRLTYCSFLDHAGSFLFKNIHAVDF
jgi:hypothetical protein